MQINQTDIAAPSAASCLPYQCGSDPGNTAAIYACSVAGFAAAKSCADPDCQPYCPNPAITPILSPPPQATPTPAAPAQPVLALTSTNITQPMPDITRVLQPIIVAPVCDAWSELNGAIASNRLLAILGLGGLLLLTFGGKK